MTQKRVVGFLNLQLVNTN